jgi:peptidoglycan/LPS O-acetylase OafA/YrhL
LLGWIVAGFFALVCLWRFLVPSGRGTAVLFAALYTLHAILIFAPDALQILPVRFIVWLLPVFDAPFRISALAFLGGALCWRCRAHLRFEARWLAVALAVLTAGIACHQWSFAMPLALPYVVLYLGFRLPFQKIARLGDYSYGIYIFSFPLQQLLVQFGFARAGLSAYLAISLVLSLAVGIISWFCIEKPTLDLGHKLGTWRPAFFRRLRACQGEVSVGSTAPAHS